MGLPSPKRHEEAERYFGIDIVGSKRFFLAARASLKKNQHSALSLSERGASDWRDENMDQTRNPCVLWLQSEPKVTPARIILLASICGLCT
jgi:hypothetical protein